MTNEVVHDPTVGVEETRAIVPLPREALTYRADNPSDPPTVTNTMVSINATSIATTLSFLSFFVHSSFTNYTFRFSK